MWPFSCAFNSHGLKGLFHWDLLLIIGNKLKGQRGSPCHICHSEPVLGGLSRLGGIAPAWWHVTTMRHGAAQVQSPREILGVEAGVHQAFHGAGEPGPMWTEPPGARGVQQDRQAKRWCGLRNGGSAPPPQPQGWLAEADQPHPRQELTGAPLVTRGPEPMPSERLRVGSFCVGEHR